MILKILGTIATGNTYQCASLVEKGGIEIFLKALKRADINGGRTTLEIVSFYDLFIVYIVY